jgi:hypothetical protein
LKDTTPAAIEQFEDVVESIASAIANAEVAVGSGV